MSTHDRLDNHEHADGPQDDAHGISRDDDEAIDTALQAEQSPEGASASASDADAGELSAAGESE